MRYLSQTAPAAGTETKPRRYPGRPHGASPRALRRAMRAAGAGLLVKRGCQGIRFARLACGRNDRAPSPRARPQQHRRPVHTWVGWVGGRGVAGGGGGSGENGMGTGYCGGGARDGTQCLAARSKSGSRALYFIFAPTYSPGAKGSRACISLRWVGRGEKGKRGYWHVRRAQVGACGSGVADAVAVANTRRSNEMQTASISTGTATIPNMRNEAMELDSGC
jgi:hypothetical protein